MDKRDEDRLIRALMVFVLICLLFHMNLAVTFGQMVSPQKHGNVKGTIYYSDGVTPLAVNDKQNGSYIQLWNTTTDTITASFPTNDYGKYASPSVPEGSYYLDVLVKNNLKGASKAFYIVGDQNISVDLTTSRTPKLSSCNKIKLLAAVPFLQVV